MHLFFDVESSGLLRDDKPLADPAQPHMVQLAAILYSPKWEVRGKLVCLVRPDNWSIEPEAEGLHGISEQSCYRYGVTIWTALSLFRDLTYKAQKIVSHNIQFDRRMVEVELARLGADGAWWKKKCGAIYCTMEASADICRLPGEFGWKFPTLQEAHNHFYPGAKFVSTHRAEDDVIACADIFRALTEREEIDGRAAGNVVAFAFS